MEATDAERDMIIATVLCFWRLLGFPLAFNKAVRGSLHNNTVTWIGSSIQISI